MRLKSKIVLIYISSTILSVMVFLAVIAYLMANGWWAGIDSKAMEAAAEGISVQLSESKTLDTSENERIIAEWEENHPGMKIELFSGAFELIYSTNGKQSFSNMEELLKALSKHGQYYQKIWVSAREIMPQNGEKGYLVIVVPSKNYSAITYSINFPKGTGIVGKMLLLGLVITLLITIAFAYLFTRSIIRRFIRLYEGISGFSLGNTDVVIDDSSNDEIGALAFIFNKMAEKLRKQVDEERGFQEERRKLVSNISHDLRTPLTSIIAYSESLENDVCEDEAERKQFITIIREKALYINQLLCELLDYSKLESELNKLNKEDTDVSELIREILIEYLPFIQENNMELSVDIPDMPIIAHIDKNAVSRVVRNLIDNAIKHGVNADVLEVVLEDQDHNMLLVIYDNGIGINEGNQERVFDRFYMEDKGRNSEDGGMGLGLAIAYEIIKMHGGNISVVSTQGQGTSFRIILPK